MRPCITGVVLVHSPYYVMDKYTHEGAVPYFSHACAIAYKQYVKRGPTDMCPPEHRHVGKIILQYFIIVARTRKKVIAKTILKHA